MIGNQFGSRAKEKLEHLWVLWLALSLLWQMRLKKFIEIVTAITRDCPCHDCSLQISTKRHSLEEPLQIVNNHLTETFFKVFVNRRGQFFPRRRPGYGYSWRQVQVNSIASI